MRKQSTWWCKCCCAVVVCVAVPIWRIITHDCIPIIQKQNRTCPCHAAKAGRGICRC